MNSFIGLVVLLFLHHFVLVSGETVESNSDADVASNVDTNTELLWHPKLPDNVKLDYQPHHQCNSPPFKTFELPEFDRKYKNFNWNSIAMFVHNKTKQSFILMGGSQLASAQANDNSIIPENNLVILCKLLRDESGVIQFKPDPKECQALTEKEEESQNENLGASVDALELSSDLAVIAYCDPLWRGTEGNLPFGRCFLNLVKSGEVKSKKEIQICKYVACMGGYSVALSSTSNEEDNDESLIKSINIWTGSPLDNRKTGIRVMTDPLRDNASYRDLETNGLKKKTHDYLGYSVVPGYATVYGYPTNNSSEFAKIVSKGLGYKTLNVLSTYDARSQWRGILPETDIFQGFGIDMISLKSDSRIMLVVGAPYANMSRGRIYLYCTKQVVENIQYQLYDDYLEGNSIDGMFGYSLSDISNRKELSVAVGMPGNGTTTGSVYIVAISPNCTFFKRPKEILTSKEIGFGRVLPKYAKDLDFNGVKDLLIPTKGEGKNLPRPLFFAGRKSYKAVCTFSSHEEQYTREIKAGDSIGVNIVVSIEDDLGKKISWENVLKYLPDLKSHMIPQFNPDLNKTKLEDQRFYVPGNLDVEVVKSDARDIRVAVKMVALIDVTKMAGIDTGKNPLFVGYRFVEKCAEGKQLDENGVCDNDSWLRNPLIDWSGCATKLPFKRFVCGPEPCSTDTYITVKDTMSGIIHSSDNGVVPPYNITFGDVKTSRRELVINVYNRGPMNSEGAILKLNFTGNLRFVNMECVIPKFTPKTVTSKNNDLVTLDLGTLYPNPTKPEIERQLILHTYYENFQSPMEANYSLNSGLEIEVEMGMNDPDLENNKVSIKYNILNEPNIRISTTDLSDTVYNETSNANISLIKSARVDVEEIGPIIDHRFQLENIGSPSEINNVTVSLLVPVELGRKHGGVDTLNRSPLIYLFKQMRTYIESDSKMKWTNIMPEVRIYRTGRTEGELVAECEYVEGEELINPKKLTAMNANIIERRRVRRNAAEFPADFASTTERILQEVDEEEAMSNSDEGVTYRRLFRKAPREVFQCGRESMSYAEPKCVHIQCVIPSFNKSQPLEVRVRGWLWAQTFFEQHISDLVVSTIMEVNQGAVPPGVVKAPEPIARYAISQAFYFPRIKRRFLHQVPIWPIVVGLVAGIFILAALMAILYRLGFFKRRKKLLLQRAKLSRARDEANKAHKDEVDSSKNRSKRPDSVTFWQNNPLEMQLADDDLAYTGLGRPTNPEEVRKKRINRRKHRDEVSILHPGDLSPNHGGPVDIDQKSLILSSASPSPSPSRLAP